MAQTVSTVYYLGYTCDASAGRVDIYAGSYLCSAGCQRETSDWRSYQSYCDNDVDYADVVDEAFKGAGYILVEAFGSDCTTLVDATAFQASGSCVEVIEYVADWNFATYAIVKENNNGSVSIRYYTDSTCDSPLLESVPILNGSIYTQDIDIDQATLNSTSCDEDNYRWTYSAATTISGSSKESIGSSSSGTSTGCGRFSSTIRTISKYRLKFAHATIKTADGVEYRIKSDDLSS